VQGEGRVRGQSYVDSQVLTDPFRQPFLETEICIDIAMKTELYRDKAMYRQS
jgi:hypothetical protein